MSKSNNVNPGQYKVAGRLRQDDAAREEKAKEKASVAEHELREEADRNKDKGHD